MTDPLGIVLKSDDEKRFALGVLYIPGTSDAHGEYIEADELQKAAHEYMQRGDLRLRMQHSRQTVIGTVVELVTLPWDIQADATVGKTKKKLRLPKGTILVGAVFTPEAWPAVKSGKLAGWSLGGRARRVPGNKKLPTPKQQRGTFSTVKSTAEPTLRETVERILNGER